MVRERVKKTRNFWRAPTPSDPLFLDWALLSGPPCVFYVFLGCFLGFLGRCVEQAEIDHPEIDHPKIGQTRIWPKSKLAKLELGEFEIEPSRNWPKSKLAKTQIGPSRVRLAEQTTDWQKSETKLNRGSGQRTVPHTRFANRDAIPQQPIFSERAAPAYNVHRSLNNSPSYKLSAQTQKNSHNTTHSTTTQFNTTRTRTHLTLSSTGNNSFSRKRSTRASTEH